MWKERMTAYAPYEYLIYEDTHRCTKDLLEKDLFVSEENGKMILKEAVSMSVAVPIGEIEAGNCIVDVFDTVLIARNGESVLALIIRNILERLERIERVMKI